MGFIKNFIKKKEKEIISNSDKAVKSLDKEWKSFLKKDTYLIYDDKSQLQSLVKAGNKKTTIPWYFFWHIKLKQDLEKNLTTLKKFNEEIDKFNPEFVGEKKDQYKSMFKKGDLTLDDDQQTAILTDDKYNVVVAGAGSGKTEVLITRIAYLIKRKGDRIKPKRILALAFQNKAANEISERLKKRYKINVEIRTFHSLGKKIIEDASKLKGVKAPKLKAECSEDWKYQHYIKKLFDHEIGKNKELQNEIVHFMKLFGDDQLVKEKTDFEKKEEFYNYQRNLTYTSLDGTTVKSEAEREIMNFFLMHNLNGKNINIVYESPAEWMNYKNDKGEEITPKPDFYFPDFDIYLEHWAIDKNGKVPEWFSGDNPTEEYKEAMGIKLNKYKENEKALIETSQADFNRKDFHKTLRERFLKALQEKNKEKYSLEPISYNELVEKVWQECREFVKTIAVNISRYIVIAKTYRLYPKDIEKRLKSERWSPKQKAFAVIANVIYEKYQSEFQKGNYIDFSDMINKAVDYLKENKEFYSDKYDHILIDEYQDISTQRYDLIHEILKKNPACKLFSVGDDWQSIMGFAGSNLDFFIHFDKYFSHPARTDLTKNYRSIKSIVDVGTCIIKNNKEGQIEKKTEANCQETKPVLVYSSLHQKDYFKNYYEQVAKHCLDKIKEYHTEKNYPYDDFMILLRIANKPKLRNMITEYAQKLGIPISEKADRPNCVHIISVHKSKGLQSRVVIILNVDKDLYGFPCELESPDIFQTAITNNDGLREQEERRLFYVAVTRAKEEVIMYTQKCSESKFITEIKDFTKREELGY
ncbi:MAG: UvrD-helicase domain-containing protein [Nanobdellota archaeon]